MQTITQPNRIFGLDLIRAIAILWVVWSHGEFLLKDSVLEGFPYIRITDGVNLFFVLSGFLIGGILLRDFEKTKEFNQKQLFLFWKRRWFRTLPTYYLILLINVIFVRYGIIKEEVDHINYSFLFFSQNLKSPFCCFFWESWSLSVEEWFYIISPLLIILLSKFFTFKKSFIVTTIIMIMGPLLYRASIYNASIDPFLYDNLFRKTVFCRLDSLAFGLLAAWLSHYYTSIWIKVRIPAFVIGISLIIILVNVSVSVQTLYRQIFYYTIVPISVFFLLPFAESIKKVNGKIANAISYISKISYSMYLVNLALVAEVIRDNFAPQNGTDAIIKYAAFWVIVIIAASLLYHYFEKPMMDLRDKKIKIPFPGLSSKNG